jgi:hypothetical protein
MSKERNGTVEKMTLLGVDMKTMLMKLIKCGLKMFFMITGFVK